MIQLGSAGKSVPQGINLQQPEEETGGNQADKFPFPYVSEDYSMYGSLLATLSEKSCGQLNMPAEGPAVSLHSLL